MVNRRLRTGWLAGSGALVLVLAFSGAAMGAPLVTDTTATFEDIDGDGVDDDCQEAALENTEAATAAFEAADLNDDGTISVTEAAQSGWTGGTNCNHGGYVSQVAQADDEACDEPETGDGETGDEVVDEADCDADDATDDEAEDADTAEEDACEEVAAPELDPATDTSEWNHGAWVSWVANSPATGGKNCNHGGAVSEASKAAKEGAKAERDAKKAEQKAARDARKAERAAERAAAKAAKSHGHGKPN